MPDADAFLARMGWVSQGDASEAERVNLMPDFNAEGLLIVCDYIAERGFPDQAEMLRRLILFPKFVQDDIRVRTVGTNRSIESLYVEVHLPSGNRQWFLQWLSTGNIDQNYGSRRLLDNELSRGVLYSCGCELSQNVTDATCPFHPDGKRI